MAQSHETGERLPAVLYPPHGIPQPLTDFRVSVADENYMQMALDLAAKALAAGDYPVGAVIVDTYGDIYSGMADEFATQRLAGHAEQNAIRRFNETTGKRDLTGCTMYVTQSPCVGCSYQIDQGQLSMLHQSATRDMCNEATMREVGINIVRPREIEFDHVFNDSNRNITVVTGLLAADSIALFVKKARQKAIERPTGHRPAFLANPRIS